MIGQVSIGKSFGGVVRYVLEKDKAEVLDVWGIRAPNSIVATADFNAVRCLRPKIKNAVWHASLSFAHADKLSRDQMIEIGKDYLEKICLYDHQYLMVRHHDTCHDHIHIIANRIGFNGHLASDRWSKNRTARTCDMLEEKYGLTVARNQWKNKLLTSDKVPLKKQVKDQIRLALSSCLEHGFSDFDQLSATLKDKGIELVFHTQKTGRINGISFRCQGLTFKGSSIDSSFSFRSLVRRLSQNRFYDKDKDHDKRRKN
jgi:hypothetical protein